LCLFEPVWNDLRQPAEVACQFQGAPLRKLLIVLTVAVTASIGFAGTASAAPTTAFTCSQFQDPTVEFVWSHVCHF
jgi:hypothetical protein